jgi:hypothetical protein
MTSNRWVGFSILSFRVFPLFLGIPFWPPSWALTPYEFFIYYLKYIGKYLSEELVLTRWSPVYVPEIETGRHVKNNACTVEIKIKWMIRKHMTYENICTGTIPQSI